jgi:hypothetical protein
MHTRSQTRNQTRSQNAPITRSQTRSQGCISRNPNNSIDVANVLVDLLNTKYTHAEEIDRLNGIINKQRRDIVYWMRMAEDWEELYECVVNTKR